jgi:general stress protein 26
MEEWIDDVTSLLFESNFMTLASVGGDGLPWVSPVEFACDDGLRFYWFSPIDARHSQNVRANPRAALSIYDCAYVPLTGQPTALYGEGPVEELHRSELEAVLPSLERWVSWRDEGRETPRPGRRDRFDGDSPWRLYRVTPATLYALHPDGHPEHGEPASWRVPVDLTDSFVRVYRSRLA